MSDVVDLLEEIGKDASLAQASVQELMSRWSAAGGADMPQSCPLLCMQFPAEEEGEEEREPEPDLDEPLRDDE